MYQTYRFYARGDAAFEIIVSRSLDEVGVELVVKEEVVVKGGL